MAEVKNTEIAGTIRSIVYRNAETGYMVLKLDKNTTLCGVYHDASASLEGARDKGGRRVEKAQDLRPPVRLQ